jgi:hypothetical protein
MRRKREQSHTMGKKWWREGTVACACLNARGREQRGASVALMADGTRRLAQRVGRDGCDMRPAATGRGIERARKWPSELLTSGGRSPFEFRRLSKSDSNNRTLKIEKEVFPASSNSDKLCDDRFDQEDNFAQWTNFQIGTDFEMQISNFSRF